jgi:hypothetical protein
LAGWSLAAYVGGMLMSKVRTVRAVYLFIGLAVLAIAWPELGLWAWPVLPMFLFPSCVCCGGACALCATGTSTSQFQVDVSGFSDFGSCGVCASLDGTYVLTQISPTSCQWRYDFTETCAFNRVLINMTSFFGILTDVVFTDGEPSPDFVKWTKTFGSQPDCQGLSAESFPVSTTPSIECSITGSTCEVTGL